MVSPTYPSQDIMITPLTSQTGTLLPEEFVLSEWAAAGLNVMTAVKRGIYTINSSLVIKKIGTLASPDVQRLETSLRSWLGL